MKNCYYCKNPLSGMRSKFCSDLCYHKNKAEREKRRKKLRRESRKPQNCEICNKDFFPIRNTIYACSKQCSKERLALKRKERESKIRKFVPLEIGSLRLPKIESISPVFMGKRTTNISIRSDDPHKNAIQQYIQNGGEILKFPEEPRAKLPSVNLRFYSELDEMMGFGTDIQHQDLVEEEWF